MFSDEVRIKLENIINGVVIEEQKDTCTTIRNLLCGSFSTSTTVKEGFESKSVIKEEQVMLSVGVPANARECCTLNSEALDLQNVSQR